VARTLERDGRRILLVHGAPGDPLRGYVYPDADLAGWDALPYDAVLMGHTHRPFARRIGDVLVANAGSVGFPRDAGGVASFAIYDTGTGECEHVRVPFDAGEVMRRAGRELHPLTVAALRRSPGVLA
jgi:predicted phosphodiesterase